MPCFPVKNALRDLELPTCSHPRALTAMFGHTGIAQLLTSCLFCTLIKIIYAFYVFDFPYIGLHDLIHVRQMHTP